MSIRWLFDTRIKTTAVPKISGHPFEIVHNTLCLRSPWVTDSVFMGKMYTASIVLIGLLSYSLLLNLDIDYTWDDFYYLIVPNLVTPLIFAPFLAYRILLIKKLSGIYLNRDTKKIYYKRFKTTICYDWNNIAAGIFARTEFGGASFTTSYALAFAPRRADGSLHKEDCLWIDSNEPTEPDIQYVAEVWEYLRQFMDHGPDKLPPPGEPNWLHAPLHAICMTPAEAWRHYAPWRTGEPGEMQGKKLWLLPFWAVLFPYNFGLAVCWYVVCRLFNVRAAPPPPEAFEEAPARPAKRRKRK